MSTVRRIPEEGTSEGMVSLTSKVVSVMALFSFEVNRARLMVVPELVLKTATRSPETRLETVMLIKAGGSFLSPSLSVSW